MEDRIETRKLFDDGLISGGEAQQILRPYLGHIGNCIGTGIRGWEAFQEALPTECVPLTSRTIAGIINDLMVDYARHVFSPMQPQVVTSDGAGFLVVDFLGRLKMRFKKLSRRLHPYNYATHQQRACEEQTLFGPAATFVTAGYRMTDLGEFQDAHIVCWNASELRWSIQLPDVLELRQRIPVTPEPDMPQPIVRAKKLPGDSAEIAG